MLMSTLFWVLQMVILSGFQSKCGIYEDVTEVLNFIHVV